jgi:hypothetical protein
VPPVEVVPPELLLPQPEAPTARNRHTTAKLVLIAPTSMKSSFAQYGDPEY